MGFCVVCVCVCMCCVNSVNVRCVWFYMNLLCPSLSHPPSLPPSLLSLSLPLPSYSHTWLHKTPWLHQGFRALNVWEGVCVCVCVHVHALPTTPCTTSPLYTTHQSCIPVHTSHVCCVRLSIGFLQCCGGLLPACPHRGLEHE